LIWHGHCYIPFAHLECIFAKERSMKKIQQGFTLIELMIVVAIIGILAAIAIPQYQDYTVRTHVSEGLNLAGAAKTAIADFSADRGHWPTNNGSAGLAPATSILGNAVTSVTVAANVITVAYNDRARNASCTLTATDNGGSISFLCRCTGLTSAQTPSACRP
jgi:type IV pilus assembly protein PilA